MHNSFLIILLFLSFFGNAQNTKNITIEKLVRDLNSLELNFDSEGLIKNNSNINIKGKIATSFQKIDSIVTWSWDYATSQFVFKKQRQINFSYDLNNNRIGYLAFNWSGTAMIPIEYLFTYDANNNTSTYLYKTWNGTALENAGQYLYTYDINNNRTNTLIQHWNAGVWVNYEQYLSTYDVNNNRTSRLYQVWDGLVWLNYYQYFYTYDVNNNQTSYLEQVFINNAWENNYQSFYAYDINNNLTSDSTKEWNGTAWGNFARSFYTYDVNNNLVIDLNQDWNSITWVDNLKLIYSYDSNNNVISKMYQGWNGSVWINGFNDLYTYDANGFKLVDKRFQYNSSPNFINGGDSTYYYFNALVGLNELNSKLKIIFISPNPTNSILSITSSIDYSSIKIINSIGQTVANFEDNPTKISVSDLSNGIYFIQLLDKKGNLLKTEKFIKE